jgi:hypothetical protein
MGLGITWLIGFVVGPICGGILAASGFIVAKNPNAQVLIDKLAPYKGAIGLGMLGLGVWNLLQAFRWGIGGLFGSLFGIGVLITILTLIVVGFLLGFGMIAKYAGGAAEKGAELQKKLIIAEVPLGFLSIGAGVFCLLFYLGILGG